MATRSRTTFKKRQKELARLEKQRDKAARRMQRKLEKGQPHEGDENPEEAFDGDIVDGEVGDDAVMNTDDAVMNPDDGIGKETPSNSSDAVRE